MNYTAHILIGICISLSFISCQVYPIQGENLLNPNILSYHGDNLLGIDLAEKLGQNQTLNEQTFQLLKKEEEILFAHAKFYCRGIYNGHFFVPIQNKHTQQIDKALIYNTIPEDIDSTSNKKIVTYKPSITDVYLLDEKKLKSLPQPQRILFSAKFKDLKDSGLKVAEGLVEFVRYHYHRIISPTSLENKSN